MIVRRAHLPALKSDERVEIAAIYGRNRDAAAALATEFGIGFVTDNIEDITTAGNLDALVVALPNNLHRAATDLAVRAGLHILMEKPLADTLADAEAMVAAAEAAGLAFQVNLPQRRRPALQWMKQAIEDRRIGAVESVEISMLRRAGIPGFGTWFTRKAIAGGGVLADLGPHVVDLGFWLSGSTTAHVSTASVWSSHGRHARGLGDWAPHGAVTDPASQFDVDDRATFTLVGEHGARLTAGLAWAYAGADENRIKVIGTEGGLDYWPEGNSQVHPLVMYDKDLMPEVVPIPADHGDLTASWNRCVREFVDSLVGEAPKTSGREALTVQKIISGIYSVA